MAKMQTKGTNLQEEIAMSFTTVAQLTSISFSEARAESVETDTLDTATSGIAKSLTGRVDFGGCDIEGFYSADLSGHQLFTDKLTTPVAVNWKVVWTDGASKETTFTNAGLSWAVQGNTGDFVKFTSSIEIDGNAVWPT